MRRVVIEFLARALVNRLEDRGLIEFRDAEAAILIVMKVLEENRGRVAEEMRRIAREE